MSFPFKHTHKKNLMNKEITKRKEKDSILTHHNKKYYISHLERASAFTPKASLTVEAALAVPIFFFAVLSLVYLLEMIHIQTVMRYALHDAAKETAKEAYLNPCLISAKLEKEIVEIIGEERLEQSMVCGGTAGLDCRKSKTWGNTGIMDLSLEYKMEVPILMFRIPVITKEEKLRVKGWNGYAGSGFGNAGKEIVYITETGLVYHKDADCTYLELSIKPVDQSNITELRNESGGKYYPCEFCMRKVGTGGKVYITDTGNRYHGSLGCGGLKRTVYAVPISEVYGRGGCSRCVK